MFCNEGKCLFLTSTQILESVYVPGHTILKVNIKAIKQHCRNSIILHWLEKSNDFAEFKIDLIHRKQVPLLHNTEY